MLRAFDPITLEELWNSQLDLTSDANKTYFFAKFVPPTIAQWPRVPPDRFRTRARLRPALDRLSREARHAKHGSHFSRCSGLPVISGSGPISDLAPCPSMVAIGCKADVERATSTRYDRLYRFYPILRVTSDRDCYAHLAKIITRVPPLVAVRSGRRDIPLTVIPVTTAAPGAYARTSACHDWPCKDMH